VYQGGATYVQVKRLVAAPAALPRAGRRTQLPVPGPAAGDTLPMAAAGAADPGATDPGATDPGGIPAAAPAAGPAASAGHARPARPPVELSTFLDEVFGRETR
jgi:hypothetical protein